MSPHLLVYGFVYAISSDFLISEWVQKDDIEQVHIQSFSEIMVDEYETKPRARVSPQ